MSRRLSILAFSTLAVVLAGADEPLKPHKVTVGSLVFEAPASWKSIPPQSSMRKVQLKLDPVASDTTPGDFSIYVFPDRAGSVEANVARWQAQFKDADGKTPAVESKRLKGKNVDVTRVACAGTFTDPFGKAGAQKGYRLLGAIVELPDGGYYLKLLGPEKTIEAAEKDFDALIATLSRN